MWLTCSRSYYNGQVCGGEMREKENWNGLCFMKTVRTGDESVLRKSLTGGACTDLFGGHGDVPAQAASKGHVWVHGHQQPGSVLISVAQCYHQRPCECPWSGLPPRALLMSKDYAELALPLVSYITQESEPHNSHLGNRVKLA